MFTGIITRTGKLIKKADGFSFQIPADCAKKISKGASIAINGACLTVRRKAGLIIQVDIMPETLKKTTLGTLMNGDLINLELPITPESFLSGHLLTGHVDGLAKLESITKAGNSRILGFSVPGNLSKYIAQKGSIAVNGISLTVIRLGKNYFTVGIVPYTWKQTNLHTLKKGDYANIETDILAKYLERILGK